MSRKLLALVIPAGLISALAAIPIIGRFSGVGGENAWILWTGLFAFVLLAGAGAAAFFRAWRWIAIPLAGFVFQVGGILYLATADPHDQETKWPGTIVATFLVMLLVVFVILLQWAWSTHRSGNLEKYLVKGMGEGAGGDPRDIQRIQQNMMEALSTLRRAGKGRNAIYELPWFLVFGRPAAGKTVAIKQSGLGLPVRKDWVKGTGGTYTADWFFTNEMIFVDTPGRWVMEGADEKGRAFWRKLLQLLLKFRGRRPLDGLIVVVPSEDLLGLAEDELEDQASRVRDVIDLIHEELRFQFPVYVLVSKCDLVDGFVDFFHGLAPQRRHEILGWSNEDPMEPDVGDLVEEGFERVQRRLEAYRLEMVARAASRQRARRLFMFTEEFEYLRQPLKLFCETLFAQDTYRATPFFRGFYFCSGTQGEGSPMSRAVSRFSEAMGVKAPAAGPASDEPKRSYFLLDLFRELMVLDKGLVKRSAIHWLKQNRDTKLGAFLPAVFFGTLLFFVGIAFFWNMSVYKRAEQAITDTVETAGNTSWAPDYTQSPPQPSYYEQKLQQAKAIRSWELDKLPPAYNALRWFGTDWHDHPDGIKSAAHEAWQATLKHGVLRPMLGKAEKNLDDAMLQDAWDAPVCSQQLDFAASILSLRLLPAHLKAPDAKAPARPKAGADSAAQASDPARQLETSLALLWGAPDPRKVDALRLQFETEFRYVSGARSGRKAAELLEDCYATLGLLTDAVSERCADFCQGTRYHGFVTNVLSGDADCLRLPRNPEESLSSPADHARECACRKHLWDVASGDGADLDAIKALGADVRDARDLSARLLSALSTRDGDSERQVFEPIATTLAALPAAEEADIRFLAAFDDTATGVLKETLDDKAFRDCGNEIKCFYDEQRRVLDQREPIEKALKAAGKVPPGIESLHADAKWDVSRTASLAVGVAHWWLTEPPCERKPGLVDPDAPTCQSAKAHADPQQHAHCHVCPGPDGKPVKAMHDHEHAHPHAHARGDAQYPCTTGKVVGPAPPTRTRPKERGDGDKRQQPERQEQKPESAPSQLTWFSAPPSPVRLHGRAAWAANVDRWSQSLLAIGDSTAPAALADKRTTLTEATKYVGDFQAAWLAHVKGVQLLPLQGELKDWLRSAAEMRAEYQEKLLQPLDDVLQEADIGAQDPALAAILQRATLQVRPRQQDLQRFLEDWAADLDAINMALEDLDGRKDDIDKFRREIQSQQRANPVVALRSHVKSKGTFLADRGASFAAPLDAVDPLLQDMLTGISIQGDEARREKIAAAWKEVQVLWNERLEGHFPFGDPKADSPVDPADVIRFFNQKDGAVKTFDGFARGIDGLSPDIVSWTQKAQRVGQELFGRDSDTLQTTKATLSIRGEPTTDDSRVTVDRITVSLATGQYFWSRSAPAAGVITLDMFDSATIAAPSTVSVTVSVDPAAQRDYFASKRAVATPDQLSEKLREVPAPWSPLTLLAATGGSGDFSRSQVKSFAGTWRSPSGTRAVNVSFDLAIDAKPLAPYFRLYPTNTLPPPPTEGIDLGRLRLPG